MFLKILQAKGSTQTHRSWRGSKHQLQVISTLYGPSYTCLVQKLLTRPSLQAAWKRLRW